MTTLFARGQKWGRSCGVSQCRFIRSSEAPGHASVALGVNDQESPSTILEVFEGRLKLIALNQESDALSVVVEFNDKGEILHVEVNGVPHALVVHQPG